MVWWKAKPEPSRLEHSGTLYVHVSHTKDAVLHTKDMVYSYQGHNLCTGLLIHTKNMVYSYQGQGLFKIIMTRTWFIHTKNNVYSH
jgi:hypothetical protein